MTEINIPNKNEPQDLSTSEPKPAETFRTGGSKIIQPITENLLIDPLPLKSQPPTQPSISSPAKDAPFDPIAHGTQYTYVPNTNSSANTDSVTAIDRMSKGNKTSKIINIWIIILGIFIIAVSLYSLVFGIISTVKYPSASGGFGVILSLGQLLLGVGILKRHELARSIYVILAIISVVFAVYSTFIFFSYGQQSYQQSQQVVANINAQTEKLTVQYQNNQSLSETQKNEKIEALKEAQKGYQQAFSGSRTKTVLSILLLWATSLVPLIFLTRERVKQEFN